MKKSSIHKWIKIVTPEENIAEAAADTLRDRLRAVKYYLPLAARKADKDIEYVHNLRVWTRRASTAIDLYGESLPQRQAAWLKKRLRQLRRAAGNARDYDVLIQSFEKKNLEQSRKRLLKLRAKAQKPLLKRDKQLKHGDRLQLHAKKLINGVHHDSTSRALPFGPWASTRLWPVVNQFFETAPGKNADMETLHRFRIRGKELRYAMELFAPAFPPDFRDKLYPVVEEMQDRLGQLHDLITAQAHVQTLLKHVGKAEKQRLLQWLAQKQVEAEQVRHDFLRWCTPRFLDAFHEDFTLMLHPRKL